MHKGLNGDSTHRSQDRLYVDLNGVDVKCLASCVNNHAYDLHEVQQVDESGAGYGGESGMHILEMITPARIGGAETQLVTLTKQLTAHGNRVTVFCPEGRTLVDYLKRYGIDPLTWKTWGTMDIKSLLGLALFMRSQEVDVVHTHLATASFVGSLAAHLARKPSIATAHGFSAASWYRFADRVIAVSHAVKDHLVTQGIPAARIHAIHNGVLLDRYQPEPVEMAKRACGFAPDVPRVAVVGRLSPEKGHVITLQAWRHVLTRYMNAQLMFIGEGKEEVTLRTIAIGMQMSDRVEFYGFVPDPRRLMAACDLIIVPSLKEGLGLTAIEAMALERPVIASEVGGLSEVVIDNETGLLVPPGKPMALTAAIISLLRDHRQAQRLAKAGRRRVENRFNATQQVARVHDVLLSEIKAARLGSQLPESRTR